MQFGNLRTVAKVTLAPAQVDIRREVRSISQWAGAGITGRIVAAVSAYTGAPAVYQNAPTFAYAIGEYSVDKEGTLTGPANEALITALQVRGFIAK